jgi:hypothetical protein
MFLGERPRAGRAGGVTPGSVREEHVRSHQPDPSRSLFPHPRLPRHGGSIGCVDSCVPWLEGATHIMLFVVVVLKLCERQPNPRLPRTFEDVPPGCMPRGEGTRPLSARRVPPDAPAPWPAQKPVHRRTLERPRRANQALLPLPCSPSRETENTFLLYGFPNYPSCHIRRRPLLVTRVTLVWSPYKLASEKSVAPHDIRLPQRSVSQDIRNSTPRFLRASHCPPQNRIIPCVPGHFRRPSRTNSVPPPPKVTSHHRLASALHPPESPFDPTGRIVDFRI